MSGALVEQVTRTADLLTDSELRLLVQNVDELLHRRQTEFAGGGETPGETARIRIPALGLDVLYRSRTGDYWLSARVARTNRSSSAIALSRAKDAGLDVPVLGTLEVDLVVFTTGGSDLAPHGTYTERAIPYDPSGAPGTWCWHEDQGDDHP